MSDRGGHRECLRIAARHRYLEARSAAVTDGVVTITGNVGYEKCNDVPEQVAYLHRTRVITLRLAPTATVTRVSTRPSIHNAPLARTALPRYLRVARLHPGIDHETFFAYDGPRHAVTSLAALYHP